MMGQILLITGATGLVGKALVKHCLAEGYTVHYLTTRKSKIITQKHHKGFYWNPQNNTIDTTSKTKRVIHDLVSTLSKIAPTYSRKWRNIKF